jgi:hypothetical protein
MCFLAGIVQEHSTQKSMTTEDAAAAAAAL